jgi:hypothetical protein
MQSGVLRNLNRRIDEIRNIFGTGHLVGLRVGRRFCGVPRRWSTNSFAADFRGDLFGDSFIQRIEVVVETNNSTVKVPPSVDPHTNGALRTEIRSFLARQWRASPHDFAAVARDLQFFLRGDNLYFIRG